MITVIDYGLGNLASVANALEKLEIPYEISGNPDVIKKADGLILPGVGAAGQGMKNLKKRKLDTVILNQIKKGVPILGICLGMQLLFDTSEEGKVKCLGIFDGVVKKFKKMKKVPQIGWNNIRIKNQKTRIMKKISDDNYFYYVNSYYCKPKDQSIIVGESFYGETFAGIVAKDNVVGVQFHPEKSGKVGFTLLKNFITYYVN